MAASWHWHAPTRVNRVFPLRPRIPLTQTTDTIPDLRPATPIAAVPTVGPKRAIFLGRLGIQTVSELIRHIPMRYEFEGAEGAIKDLILNAIGSARGTVMTTRWVKMGPRKGRYQATLQDKTARLDLVWFNAGYLRDKIHPGLEIRVQGKVTPFGGYLHMANPRWEILEDPDQAAPKRERLRPVYPATEDLSSLRIEELVAWVLPRVLPQIVDPLPADFVHAHAMPPLAEAFRMAHQPAHEQEAAAARRRLAFNELLLLQLGIALKKHHARTQLVAPALNWSPAIDKHIRQRFPFTLTPAQDQALAEIVADLRQSKPMNRLLQGDVGSGKTVVALYALLLSVANRKQGAIMAPTELLAQQHYFSISAMLAGSTVRLALLTGGRLDAQRKALLKEIEEGKIDIVIGTQALLTETVRFNQLGVVVVDEQHRFGVLQRAAFRERGQAEEMAPVAENSGGSGVEAGSRAAFRGLSRRAGTAKQEEPSSKSDPGAPGRNPTSEIPPPRLHSPHYLVMTATPIPRTLSMTVFGDLDISTISELPPGRLPITTRVVTPEKSDEVYSYIAQRVAKGEQAYVVVPAIDETGQESLIQLKNVRAHAKLLQDKFFTGVQVAAVHGQLKSETREAIMQRFRAGQVQVLVATTVIEVGVDVPNASIMVVEHAERFGLAQLHQLRGRIGRNAGGRRSLCVFVADPVTEEAQRRKAANAATKDGFRNSEEDFKIPGMGDFFCSRQHGLPPLRIARIPEDIPLLQLARRDAQGIVDSDPAMTGERWQGLRKVLIQQFGDSLGLIDVG